MVRKESFGTSKQKPIVKFIERALRGGSDSTGEAHKWLYDWYSLRTLLIGSGFTDVIRVTFNKSVISHFQETGYETCYLNSDPDVNLFVEGFK